MKFDLHVHSAYSEDAEGKPEEIIRVLEKTDIDGLAFMDHNSIGGYERAKEIDTDLIIVPAMEVSTEKGHVMALGLQEEIGRMDSVRDAVDVIEDHGALPIAAHPFRFWSGIGKEETLKNHWAAIEGMNGRSWEHRNIQARKLAEKMDLPVIGGSDSHRFKTLGKAYTVMEDVATWQDVLDKIERGDTDVGGESRTFYQSFFYIRRAILGWMGRGFEKI